MWHSVLYFQSRGFDILGSPWQSEENIVSWSEILLDQPKSLGGVETNWGTPYEEPHRWFADNFWNTRHRLVMFDSFEDDEDSDGLPDGWTVDGLVDYSTDGSQSQGRRYAGFPNAALGVVTDTVSVATLPLAIRPNTPHKLSAYVKREPGLSPAPRLSVEWFDSASRQIGTSSTRLTDLAEDYVKYSLDAVSPGSATHAVVRLDESQSGVWYDVVRLKERTMFFGVIGPAQLRGGVVGFPYRDALLASGGVAPARWRVGEGALPRGLTLGDGGELVGAPLESGVFRFTAEVTDSTNRSDRREFAIEVLPEAPERIFLPVAAKGARLERLLEHLSSESEDLGRLPGVVGQAGFAAHVDQELLRGPAPVRRYLRQ
jgi:hypothetical protein